MNVLAVVGVRHLCVINAQIWNVCLQNVCDQRLFGEWLCGFKILLVMWSFVLDASVRDLRIWMDVFSLCVSRISALDECLLDNCLKNVRVLNAKVQNVCLYNVVPINESMIEMTVWRLWLCGISVCLMPKFKMSVRRFVCLQYFCAGWMLIG